MVLHTLHRGYSTHALPRLINATNCIRTQQFQPKTDSQPTFEPMITSPSGRVQELKSDRGPR